MACFHTLEGKKRLAPRKRGELIEACLSSMCLGLLLFAAVSVVAWISSMRAESRAVAYMTVHNLDCMERLKADAKLSGNDLLDRYVNDEFSSADIETTVSTSQFSVDGLKGYVVRIKSKEIGSPYKLESKYVLTLIPAVDIEGSYEPEVNPE